MSEARPLGYERRKVTAAGPRREAEDVLRDDNDPRRPAEEMADGEF